LEGKRLALISLDLSKAYNTCRRYGIKRWLLERQIVGLMLQFMEGFLSNRGLKTVAGHKNLRWTELKTVLIAIADIYRSEDRNYEVNEQTVLSSQKSFCSKRQK
jgi:hypothetical protein